MARRVGGLAFDAFVFTSSHVYVRQCVMRVEYRLGVKQVRPVYAIRNVSIRRPLVLNGNAHTLVTLYFDQNKVIKNL